ncbi:hypothetical protein Tco_0647921 [Tanacetum coccineum]
MSNTNNNLQTQTSNALHNAIMEAGGKDHPPMLAPDNYNPPYKFKWTEKSVLVAEGSSETTTEGYMENYKNVSQDIRDQLNAEANYLGNLKPPKRKPWDVGGLKDKSKELSSSLCISHGSTSISRIKFNKWEELAEKLMRWMAEYGAQSLVRR